MPHPSQAKGKAEELFAETYLVKQGFSVVARNFRCRFGEIDLIVQDRNQLVFVEVRQRKHARYGSPLESVSVHKQKKLTKAAEIFLTQNPPKADQAMRFDVIGLTGVLPNVRLEWIKNAF